MALVMRVWQLFLLALLAVVRADPSVSRGAAASLRGSALAEVVDPSAGAPAAESSAAGRAQSGVMPQGPEESMDSADIDLLEDATNATGGAEATQSLIVCRGGKVCRGAWTWSGSVRVCRGGFVCRGWAAVLAEDVEGEEQQAQAASMPADLAEGEGEGEPFNSSQLLEILTNTSHATQSLIVCRGARVCRGGWTWRGRVRVCRGGFFCRRSFWR